MPLLIAIHRVGHAARCALCHDDLDAAPRSCERCASTLHAECWELAGDCPTLGCARAVRLRIEIARRYLGADWVHLGTWLALFAVVQLGAWWIAPAFERMYAEVGVQLPWLTEALMGLAAALRTPLSPYLLIASVVAFRQARELSAVRRWLFGSSVVMGVLIPLGTVALLQPTMCLPLIQRL